MEMKILDAFALMAFFHDKPGAETVENLIQDAEDGKVKLAISMINMGEVWYSISRSTSPERADHFIQEIQNMSVEMINSDWVLTRQAAIYKARGNISYADCFAAALAKLHGATLVTGDKEFKQLENEIAIEWLT